MRSYILAITLIALAATNVNFLRNLAEVASLKTVTFTDNCGTSLPESFGIETVAAVTATITPVATFKSANDSTGDKAFSYTCDTMTADSNPSGGDEKPSEGAGGDEKPSEGAGGDGEARRLAATSTTTTCTKAKSQSDKAEIIYGDYSVSSLKESDNTITIGEVESNKFTLAAAFEVAAKDKQTASQEVEKDNDDKKSFTVILVSADAAPALYSSKNETAKALTGCVLADDGKNITCTPAKGEMEDGEEYTIYYKVPCSNDFSETGVKVKYSASSFIALSKYAFVVLALFLL